MATLTPLLLRQLDDGRPDLLEELDVLLHGLVLVAADEGGDHVDAQLGGGLDEGLQVLDGGLALGKVGVHGVGVVGQGGDVHALVGDVLLHIFGVGVVLQDALGVDVADAGVAALGLAGGPAGHLQALKAHLGGGVHGLLKAPAVQDGGQKSKMNHVYSPFVVILPGAAY